MQEPVELRLYIFYTDIIHNFIISYFIRIGNKFIWKGCTYLTPKALEDIPKVAIIIPAYNPTAQLIQTIEGLQSFGVDAIIVVNDGSTNSSDSIFQQAKSLGCDFLAHNVNCGKGKALKTAFQHFLNSYAKEYIGVITVDADGQHTLPDILRIKEAFLSHSNSLVLGYRNFSGHNIPFRSKVGNLITCGIISFLCGERIEDTQTGLRAIGRSQLESFLQISGERYEYEINMLLETQKKGYPLYQIPIETVYYDNNQGSHFNPLKDSIKIYEIIFKYALSSLSSFAIDFSLFILLNLFSTNFILNTYIARICSSLFNYTVNKNIVFHYKKGMIGSTLAKYFLLLFFSSSVSGIFVTLTNKYLFISPVFSKIIIDTFLFLANYYIQKNFIFKKATKKEKTY